MQKCDGAKRREETRERGKEGVRGGEVVKEIPTMLYV
jgi:hypothetical protein